MAFADVRAALVRLLKQVDGIGQVHDYMRHSTTWEEIFKRSEDKGKINHWEVTRTAAGQEISALENLAGVDPFYHDIHTINILGRMGLNEEKASEKVFQDLVDAVVKRIRLDASETRPLFGTVLLPRLLQVPVIEHRMYGPVLCHFAQITYEAIERVGG